MSSAETTNPNAPVSLIEQWDKTFAESLKVDHRKVTFQNRYGITLVGDLYLPKDRGERKLAAIAVSGPFGAVKEQSSGLYAQTLAEQGLSPWRLTHRIRAKAVATHATWPHRISIPRILVPRWTFWACKRGGSQPYRFARHLWLGRYGPERRGDGYTRQSGGDQRNV